MRCVFRPGRAGCDFFRRSVVGELGPVALPIVVGAGGAELEHGFGRGVGPPRARLLEPLLKDLPVAALDFARTDRQAPDASPGVIQVLPPFLEVVVNGPHGRGLLFGRFALGGEGLENRADRVTSKKQGGGGSKMSTPPLSPPLGTKKRGGDAWHPEPTTAQPAKKRGGCPRNRFDGPLWLSASPSPLPATNLHTPRSPEPPLFACVLAGTTLG